MPLMLTFAIVDEIEWDKAIDAQVKKFHKIRKERS
jgi:hypothetical protein